MNTITPMILLFISSLVLGCNSNDPEASVPDDEIVLDACGNVTTETVSDKRCLYKVSTLTAQFNGSGGLTVDQNDFIYVADFGSKINDADGEIVSKIDPATGEVTLFASGLVGPSGNTFAKNGNLIQANIKGNFISEITPDGEVSTISNVGLSSPVGVVLDDSENLFVCNCGGNSIQKINSDGNSSLFVANQLLNCPNGITIDDDGNLYIANFNNSNVIKIAPDGTIAAFATLPGRSNSHLVYGNNKLYVLSRGGNKLYEVTLDGDISVIAGINESGNKDGDGDEASFYIPNGIGISNDGSKVYVVSRLVGEGSPLNPVVVRVVEEK